MRKTPGARCHTAERDAAEPSRERVLAAAAAQMRAHGVRGVSVGEVMAAAGLTHGAFYAHFRSKDALVAEAVSAIFEDPARRGSGLRHVLEQTDEDLPAAFRAYLARYLSARHRDGPERGCPLPSLSAEMARSDSEARSNCVSGMEGMMAGIAAILARLGHDAADARARVAVSQMVGAIGLARMTGPGELSDAIIRDCLADLVEAFGL